MARRTVQLAIECKRQHDNCLYTATTLYIWLRWLRGLKVFFTIAPIVCGALGSWRILAESGDGRMTAIGAIGSFMGGLLSTIYAALKLDTHIAEVKVAAGELTSLRDGFRQTALVSSLGSFDAFESEVARLKARLDKVRAMGLTPPDLFFKLAQRKVASGDYSFDVDEDALGGSTHPSSLPSSENLPESK